MKEKINDIDRLINIAIETAFDKSNKNTESLCRRLLAMGKIKLNEKGFYTRDPLDWEKHFKIDNIVYDREKAYFVGESELDDYTKQLEEKVKDQEKEIKKLKEKINKGK